MSSQSSGSRHETPRVTRTEEVLRSALANDKVIQLREWAADTTYSTPSPGTTVVVGAHPSADLRLPDSDRSLSRYHARLICDEHGELQIEDLQSRNGIYIDGVLSRRRRNAVPPGMEIRIGATTLIAETAMLVRLRRYLARLFGWRDSARVTVDHALREFRRAERRFGHLWFIGDDDLVAVARQIHLHTMRPGAPFVVCRRRRRGYRDDAGVRITTHVRDASEALRLGHLGTICVRAQDQPKRHHEIDEAASETFGSVRLSMCAPTDWRRPERSVLPIFVPPLATRRAEDRARIVDEYARDAVREFQVDGSMLNDGERAWILRHDAGSYADIEVATSRVVARNAAGSIHLAAEWLGLSHTGLGTWFDRRPGLKR